jgi:hypothetical protein
MKVLRAKAISNEGLPFTTIDTSLNRLAELSKFLFGFWFHISLDSISVVSDLLVAVANHALSMVFPSCDVNCLMTSHSVSSAYDH